MCIYMCVSLYAFVFEFADVFINVEFFCWSSRRHSYVVRIKLVLMRSLV